MFDTSKPGWESQFESAMRDTVMEVCEERPTVRMLVLMNGTADDLARLEAAGGEWEPDQHCPGFSLEKLRARPAPAPVRREKKKAAGGSFEGQRRLEEVLGALEDDFVIDIALRQPWRLKA